MACNTEKAPGDRTPAPEEQTATDVPVGTPAPGDNPVGTLAPGHNPGDNPVGTLAPGDNPVYRNTCSWG